MKLGIQLYTVREHTGDEEFKSTLTKLAEMGFQGVEFAWKYGGMEPKELSNFLKSLGLECCGLHIKLPELLDPNHKVYEYALASGSQYITTSLAGQTGEFETLCPQLNDGGTIAADKELQFTYHNHYQEFENKVGEVTAQDYLTENTDPQKVKMEIDIGWVKRGGLDPMEYWQQHGTRTPQIHLRDYSDTAKDATDIGAGFIDMDKVVAQGKELNVDWLIYEQSSFPIDAFASCKICVERCREAGMI